MPRLSVRALSWLQRCGEIKFWLDSFGEGVRVTGISKSCSYCHQHLCDVWKSNSSEDVFLLLFTISSGVVATLTPPDLDFLVNTSVIRTYWCQSSKIASPIVLALPILHYHPPQAGRLSWYLQSATRVLDSWALAHV